MTTVHHNEVRFAAPALPTPTAALTAAAAASKTAGASEAVVLLERDLLSQCSASVGGGGGGGGQKEDEATAAAAVSKPTLKPAPPMHGTVWFTDKLYCETDPTGILI